MSAGGAGSCSSCHAWGALYSGVCRGCYDFARRHEPGPCGTCRRDRPLKEGYCRNCWLQAALQAAGSYVDRLRGAAQVHADEFGFEVSGRLRMRPRMLTTSGPPITLWP